jgi:hypothetical protein
MKDMARIRMLYSVLLSYNGEKFRCVLDELIPERAKGKIPAFSFFHNKKIKTFLGVNLCKHKIVCSKHHHLYRHIRF